MVFEMDFKFEELIYDTYITKDNAYYDELNIELQISKLVEMLKTGLSEDKLLLIERIIMENVKLNKLKNLHLIEYVLNNYSKK